MKYKLSVDYSEEEQLFIKENNCEIFSEVKLPKAFEEEIPQRMIKYCGIYLCEIYAKEEKRLCWAILEKYKGKFHYSSLYDNFEVMQQGI